MKFNEAYELAVRDNMLIKYLGERYTPDDMVAFEFGLVDALSDEWYVEERPVVTRALGATDIKTAWDTIRSQFRNVKCADESPVCQALINHLFNERGDNVE